MSIHFNPVRLLIIEDNPGDFILLEQYLKISQLPIAGIKHAVSLAQAHEIIANHPVDFVFLDLNLPDSRGLETFETIHKQIPHIPIIVLSGLSDLTIAIEALSLGAQDYLVKGDFDDKVLLKTIQYGFERKRIMESLRESNERFELASMATNDVIWDWDLIEDRIQMSKSIKEVFGHDTSQDGLRWLVANVHPQHTEKISGGLKSQFEKKATKWQAEFPFRSVEGGYREVFNRGYILYNMEEKPYRMIGAMTDITEQKRLEKELAAQALEQQKLITETTIQAQEKERSELGRELHDNINQILAIVKMYLGLAKSGVDVSEDLVGKSYDYLDQAMQEIRKLSHSLVAPTLGDIGLKAALQELADDTNLAGQVRVKVIVDENFDEAKLEKNKKLMLYRIVQEQLNNIHKHAQAEEAVISLAADDENLSLWIKDNGLGFDVREKAKGIGLKNINSRVEFYSGRMNISSSTGQGCTLEVHIPNSQ